MKKNALKVILVVIIAVVAISMIGPYNNLVKLSNQIREQVSQIENVLQGRLEKIPDLVKVAKTYMEHEETVFIAVAEARSGLQDAITSGDVEQMADANEQLTQTLTKFDAVVEAYPELSSSQLFIGLSAEIAESVNMILQERRLYNQKVTEYNNVIETFPTIVYARLLGFRPAKYFQASNEAHKTNVVDFGN